MFFVETNCLFCGKGDDVILYPAHLYENSFSSYAFSARRQRRQEHYQIVACRKCNLIRANPILEEANINTLYAESEFIFPEEAPYAAETYSMLLGGLIDKYASSANSLLEIGCSTGFFLEAALEMGFKEVIGFEPSKSCFEHASDKVKNRIINDIFKPELLGDRRFDIACAFHVFDHLKDPQKVLSAIADRLHRGGHIILVCHDVESWSARLLKDHSPIFDVEHIYLFSQKTMAMLFERVGLDVLEVGSLCNTYPLSYWMRMLPVVNKVVEFIPSFMKKIPVSINAGNLYIYGKKV